MFPLRILTHLSGTGPRCQNSTCVGLELLLFNCFWASFAQFHLSQSICRRVKDIIQARWWCSERIQTLHMETRILEMFRERVQTLTSLGKLITQCQHQWGLKHSPHAAGVPAYVGKRGQHDRYSTLNDQFRVHFCTCDGCHRSAVGNSSLILTSKFFFHKHTDIF